ncbi:hypothetical protein NN561_004457 [Cricetulus griseus]
MLQWMGAGPNKVPLLPLLCGWGESGPARIVRCAARGAQENSAFIFKTQTDGIEFTNVVHKEMRKITKDLAQGHSHEVKKGPQLQAARTEVEHPASSAAIRLSITASAHTGALSASWNRFDTATS